MNSETPGNNPQTNPANAPAATSVQPAEAAPPERKRIPMSIPTRRLEVPAMEGYYLYWFLEQNVPRALAAGYERVLSSEVNLNSFDIAGKPGSTGNTDLGAGVSFIGGTAANGEPQRLILMKLHQDFRNDDLKAIAQKNLDVVNAIFRDEKVFDQSGGMQPHAATVYVGKKTLLNRPMRRAKTSEMVPPKT